jgi:ribose 5-phosphate isomerase B
MNIYLGADHQGFAMKEQIFAYLVKRGYNVEDVGDKELDPQDDFPQFAQMVAL